MLDCLAGRRQAEDVHDMRDAFAIDVDRILHSRAYTSYIDKTQVFSLIGHQAISHRVIHVQLLSRIARTIGRELGLDSDLIEAIAIGHDIGHPPFGHDGEAFLDEICREQGIGRFRHNLQAIQMLEEIEKGGLNLTLAVLDGILCHNGEVSEQTLEPKPLSGFNDFDAKLAAVAEGRNPAPGTMEACVVRLADTISYIGRDIEDAITLGIIARSELPPSAVEVLGETNGKIVYALVADLTAHSTTNRLAYSERVYAALGELKDFNYRSIYKNPAVKNEGQRIRTMYRLLFERLLADLAASDANSPIFAMFLNLRSADYRQRHNPSQIVRDFLASLTDSNFLRVFQNIFVPRMPS